MCQERHDIGQEKYGVFTFLGNDIIRMTMEELADAANYIRYQYIKLGIINEFLQQTLKEVLPGDEDGNVTIGVQAFRGTKEGWSTQQHRR